jgi:hypothetical protein
MTCELLWKFFVRRTRQSGVSSGAQLSFKTFQLLSNRSVAARVREELKPSQYAAATADEAVERILEFDRNWATFELPRLLMALSRIQAHVLAKESLPHGDYQSFAARVECLFTTPVIAALDEYGIPIELGERLQQLFGAANDLDRALAVVSKLNVPSVEELSEFERDLLT